eukprot:1190904-Prorocentrum_minimum.AAC.2
MGWSDPPCALATPACGARWVAVGDRGAATVPAASEVAEGGRLDEAGEGLRERVVGKVGLRMIRRCGGSRTGRVARSDGCLRVCAGRGLCRGGGAPLSRTGAAQLDRERRAAPRDAVDSRNNPKNVVESAPRYLCPQQHAIAFA